MYNVRCRSALAGTVRLILPIILALVVAGPAQAGDGEAGWTFRLEPMLTTAYGHDQHVLTIHEIDHDATPQMDSSAGVNLETDSGLAIRGEIRYSRGNRWSWGIDATVFYTNQGMADRTAAAGGDSDEVVFEVADRSFSSTDPNQVLFFGVLDDTCLQTWTVDISAIRTLAESQQGSVKLQLGLRNADFDNDYRALVGIEDVGGRRLDASSNYDRMMGPLVGLIGSIEVGRHHLEGYLGQSVLLGSVELSGMSREFTGPLSNAFEVEAELPTTFSRETFHQIEDVAIPVTDFRLRWTYRFGRHITLGAGTNTSAWWDVPVPPGVIPAPGGDETLHENTIVFFGLLASVELTF